MVKQFVEEPEFILNLFYHIDCDLCSISLTKESKMYFARMMQTDDGNVSSVYN